MLKHGWSKDLGVGICTIKHFTVKSGDLTETEAGTLNSERATERTPVSDRQSGGSGLYVAVLQAAH